MATKLNIHHGMVPCLIMPRQNLHARVRAHRPQPHPLVAGLEAARVSAGQGPDASELLLHVLCRLGYVSAPVRHDLLPQDHLFVAKPIKAMAAGFLTSFGRPRCRKVSAWHSRLRRMACGNIEPPPF